MKSPKTDLIIYGAGGAGRELAACLSRGTQWTVLGFVDDTMKAGQIINGVHVLGGSDRLLDFPDNVAVCIVNSPKVKRGIIERIRENNSNIIFPTIINEESILSGFVEFGEGCIVAQPWNYLTVNIKIGKFVWINTRCDIGHDVEIGDYTTLFTRINVAGDVHIGKGCVIGSGVTIKPGVRIGNNVIIGGGAVVVKDIPDNVTVVGNPAKVIKQRDEIEWWNL